MSRRGYRPGSRKGRPAGPGQKAWGSGGRNVQNPEISAFEKLAEQLGCLTIEQQKQNDQLRRWAERNFRSRYVPEVLIKHWHLTAGSYMQTRWNDSAFED